jgi:HPt (histidine-containing phosphotransfer) domain-containing protein
VAALTKTIDGKEHPAGDFAYVGDAQDISTWHLPVDKDHIDSAVKMFGKEQHVPASAKGAVARKIAGKAKAAGIDTKDFEAKYCASSEHADFGNGWVEIFRTGAYGDKGTFSADDLDRVVSNYDPGFHEAPACIGHPKDDLPAYGWADRLMRQGDTLLAKFKEVEPTFEANVKAGRYKKRSAAFYLDGDGRITNLRHVAFLGAQPPEVKGLKNLNFDDNGRKFTEVDFGEESAMSTDDKSVKDQIKAFFAEMFNPAQQQQKSFSEDDLKRIATEAATAAATPLQSKVTELETKLSTQATQFAERERKLAGGETEQRVATAITRLKGAGKWIPAFDKAGIPLLFAELAKLTGTVEFGEGAEKKATAPFDLAVAFFEGLPKIVPGGRVVEVPAAQRGHASSGDPLTDAAKARQKEKKITFSEALDEIVAEQPELAVAGRSTGGAV